MDEIEENKILVLVDFLSGLNIFFYHAYIDIIIYKMMRLNPIPGIFMSVYPY